MERAGIERTLFYRHFDDLGDLLLQAGARGDRGALRDPARPRPRPGAEHRPGAIRAAIEPAVAVYERHGPLLRALSEAAAGDERIAAGQEALRARFDELVAEALRRARRAWRPRSPRSPRSARALNLMNETYLLDAFGREPRISARDRGRDPDRDLARVRRPAARPADDRRATRLAAAPTAAPTAAASAVGSSIWG